MTLASLDTLHVWLAMFDHFSFFFFDVAWKTTPKNYMLKEKKNKHRYGNEKGAWFFDSCTLNITFSPCWTSKIETMKTEKFPMPFEADKLTRQQHTGFCTSIKYTFFFFSFWSSFTFF